MIVDDTIIAGSNIPPLDVDHTLLDLAPDWIFPYKLERAHEDKRNVTVHYVFTWAVRLCPTLKQAFSIDALGYMEIWVISDSSVTLDNFDVTSSMNSTYQVPVLILLFHYRG